MNPDRLHEALTRIYQDEHARLVFWNDPQAEFSDVLDSLQLDDVQLIRLNQTGGLETKLRIERDEPQSRFLLYSPTEEPEYEDDVLLDVRLYSRNFRADRSSILLDQLGLAHQQLRAHLSLRRKFFDSKDRLARLKQLVTPTDMEQELDLKMLAVLTRSDQAELFQIVRTLYHAIAEQDHPDLEVAPAMWSQIEKFDLDGAFWAMVAESFGYQEENPTLERLLTRLLLSEFSHQLGLNAPEAVQRQQLSRRGTNNAVVCLGQWRDSTRHSSSFNVLSEIIAGQTQVAQQLSDLEPEMLIDAVTFRAVDQAILRGVLARLSATREHVDAAEIRRIVAARQDAHWTTCQAIPETQRKARSAAFEAVGVAAEFFALKNQHANGFDADTPEQMYRLYTDVLYLFDQRYRHFCWNADLAQTQGWDFLKSLREDVEAAYRQWYLVQLSLKWGRLIGGELLQTWKIPNVPNQYQFFERHVAARQRERDKLRTYVVISDAFRYEAAQELTQRLNGEYRFQAELSSQLGVLPSYTALGMAALLPHQQLEYRDNGDVLADGISTSGSENRGRILKTVDGVVIDGKDLLAMRREESRAALEGARVVYVYHNEIDTRGENAETESDTFHATHDAIDELGNLVRYLINSLQVNYLLVTADHGFLFTESRVTETDRSELEDKPAGTVKAKKRYLIGKGLPEPQMAWHGQTSVTAKCAGAMEFWIPKGTNRFHFTGGARFIHGGAMPQEVVVPVITVRQARSGEAREKTRIRTVPVSVLGSQHRITTPSHRFRLVQMEAVSERARAATVKVAIYDGEQVVSSIETLTFSSKSANPEEREQSVMLTLRDQTFDKHRRYQLQIRDASTDFSVVQYDVVIDRAIADDF